MLDASHTKFATNNLDIVKQCMHYLIKEHFLFLTSIGNQLLTLLRVLLTLKDFHIDLLLTEQTNN